MSDFFSLENPADVNLGSSGVRQGSSLDTGVLRRKFNFGDRVSELMIMQDPFFRMVSATAKKPTDDPSFKFTEKRPSWHKRYAYPIAFSNDGSTWVEDQSTNATTQYDTYETASNTVYVKMAGDYLASGNIQNVYGNSTGNNIAIGADGTTPGFFIPGQLVKINFSASAAGSVGSWAVIRIDEGGVSTQNGSGSYDAHGTADAITLKATVVKAKDADDDYFAGGLGVNQPAGDTVATSSIAESLEPSRAYVIGTAFGEGTGYPETWKDQPYATGYGQTQIWKTAMAMTNTARATQLKYEPNEWARIWKEKLIEHKWDIEHSMLFGKQYSNDNINYTQGCVDFVATYGNTFSLDVNTKTQDDFLDDLSNYLDPRYNNSKATVFFCNTAVYNWLHKLGGYFSNNLEISPNYRADMAITGKKKILGVDATTISTVYGDMNVVRDIHLDGSPVKMLGVNMKYCSYRPLVGNGLNRDTSVYVGVQKLENSGVDRRVDIILTEAGMEWQMPECHAIWT